MIAVDASVLAYAVNRGVPEHLRAGPVLEALARGERPWALPIAAAHRFVRHVTHPHAVARTLSASEAWGFVEALLAGHAVHLLLPTADHARVARVVLDDLGGAGPAPAGFETAVQLREHGVRELLSADPEMRRFRFLAVRDPVHGPAWSPEDAPPRRYRVLGGRGA